MQTSLFQSKMANLPLPSSVISIVALDKEEFLDLKIYYSFQESEFGELLIASTEKGICFLAFEADLKKAKGELEQEFKNAKFINQKTEWHRKAISFLKMDWKKASPLALHLKGSDFQFKVWEHLLNIPFGKTTQYGQIANQLNQPTAARAVGTAVGSNAVAFLIPCHRVVQNGGGLGGFRWGIELKKTLLKWEQEWINKQ